MLMISLLLLGVAIKGVSTNVFVLLMVSLVMGVVSAGLFMAKREYELEELPEKAPEKPGKVIKPPDLKKYITLQTAFLAIFTGLCITGRVPRETAIVLGGALILLLALTFLVSRPLVFQLAPKFKGVMAKRFAKALTLVSGLTTTEVALATLGYETGPLGVVLLLMTSLGVIFYAAFIALTGAYEEGYY